MNNAVLLSRVTLIFFLVTPPTIVAQEPTRLYLSDMQWSSVSNGWGPVERDRTNGDIASGDGRALSMRGRLYAKGLGVHAFSDLRIVTGARCTEFNAEVGIDDESAPRGSVVFQLWADGAKLYDSGTMLGTSAARAVSVNISGTNEIRLVVLDAGDGTGSDHADWANAAIQCKDVGLGTKYLSDLNWTSAKNGWGPPELNMSNGDNIALDGKTLQMNGQTYAKGIGVHAPSELRYSLGGSCSAFAADIGVDDEVGSRGSIVFQVWGDDRKLYESGTLYGDSPARSLNLDVTGTQNLRLVVLAADDGVGSDHGDWADARLTCPVDTTPLTITSITPTGGATAVPVNQVVTATFSKTLKSATINPTTVYLTKAGSTTPVPANQSYDGVTRTVSIAPVSVLQPGSTYTATVKAGVSGVKDSAGNTMATDKVWSFVTPSPEPVSRYLSDMTWVSAKNGWGPVERDRSNGDLAARDGLPIMLNSKTYPKGIGVHAQSDIRVNLGGNCSTFRAEIGVDAETGRRGSVIFQVWGDGQKLFQSPVLRGTSPSMPITLGIAGKYELGLVVTDADDDNGGDHADWADAQVTCVLQPETVPPYVTTTSPTPGTPVAVSTALVTAAFSEALDHTSLTSANFLVRPLNSANLIAGQVRYDTAARTAIWDPVEALDVGTTYIATLRGGEAGVKDLFGNSLSTDTTWIFTTASAGLAPRRPVALKGATNVTLSGVYIRNLEGPCVVISDGSSNIRLQNSEIGPCKGGVVVDGSRNAVVDGVYIHDSGDQGDGVDVTFSDNVAITNNRIERVRTGVYVLGSTRVRAERNRMKNMQGPMPRGQFVQFNKVNGPNNRIACNTGENQAGASRAEDAISLYASNGDPNDPIQVVGNTIVGGGPSLSGGGLMLGDGGGSYQVARDNIIVDPGQYGMAVAGGHDISLINNLVFARQQPFTNVGLYVWNQDSSTCQKITIDGNAVNWTNAGGASNAYWNAGNCTAVTEIRNNWNVAVTASAAKLPIAACSQ